MRCVFLRHLAVASVLIAGFLHSLHADNIPPHLSRWMAPQNWQRDTDGPIVELGDQGEFDDTHIFAPSVWLADKKYSLLYSGSTGRVAQRVFSLGLASGHDGRSFRKHRDNPVYSYGDGKHSVLTPALLREEDGRVLRDNGKLRMWFSATHFAGGTGLHTMHETTSNDGVNWSPPSRALLENVYAPSVIKDGEHYLMWYVDVAEEPWLFRHAISEDGLNWTVHPHPILTISQKWESSRLFYPRVVKADGVYLLWYGSYWSAQSKKTALGFAVSSDGITWHKHPDNPVLRPDASRPWESHYTTSQSVMRLPDGSWRIWYASRKKPPFVNKYFAIGTAHWNGPPPVEVGR